jgi:anti-anti-sigma factor
MTTIARVDETWQGDVPVATVTGEVDASNAVDVGDRLRALLTNHLEAMVIDLSPVTYLDSAGLNLLFALGEQLRGRQQQLALVVRDGSPIARMVAITGLGLKVVVRPSLDEAIAGVS